MMTLPIRESGAPVVRDEAVPRPGRRVAPWTDTDSPRSPGELASFAPAASTDSGGRVDDAAPIGSKSKNITRAGSLRLV